MISVARTGRAETVKQLKKNKRKVVQYAVLVRQQQQQKKKKTSGSDQDKRKWQKSKKKKVERDNIQHYKWEKTRGKKKNKLTAQEEIRKKKKENWTGIQKEILAIYSILQKKKKSTHNADWERKQKQSKKKKVVAATTEMNKKSRDTRKVRGFQHKKNRWTLKKKTPSIIQLDMSSSIKRCACFWFPFQLLLNKSHFIPSANSPCEFVLRRISNITQQTKKKGGPLSTYLFVTKKKKEYIKKESETEQKSHGVVALLDASVWIVVCLCMCVFYYCTAQKKKKTPRSKNPETTQ